MNKIDPKPQNTREKDDTLYETKLAQDINNVHDKILGLRDRLDDLLNRVEL